MVFARKVRREDGGVAVEFAILSPLLIVILFATIAFGVALSRLVSYISAAREGARYAAVHCAPDALQCTQTMIENRVAASAAGNPIGVPITVSTDCTLTPGEPVTVSWPQPIPIEIPFVGDLSVTIDITGSFRCE